MTKRNIDLLSNRDMFVKYANVVEVARNSKIQIYHSGNRNCVVYRGYKNNKHDFYIYSATPNVKGIEKFVGIIHELSHVLFQSPFKACQKLMRDYWDLDDEAHRVMFNIFNVLEDQRIESQMGKMYLKHAGRFNKTTKKLGLLMNKKLMTENPLNMLLTIRFQRGDDIIKLKNYEIYDKALKDVVLTDKYGALRILVSLKPYIEEWIKQKHEEVKRENTYDDTDEVERLYGENIIENSGETDLDIPDELLDGNPDKDKIEDMLNTSKKLGSNVVNEIFNKLRDDGKSVKLPKNVVIVKRIPQNFIVNDKVSKGMSKLFKTLQMKRKDFIDFIGDDVDVEEYVECLTRGNNMGECRINSKPTYGISIVISIDGSSSMDGQKMRDARGMVATMFESVKNLNNVDIKANVWSGTSYGKVGITVINSISEVNHISARVTETGYYSTPIHMALEYSSKMLKHMKGNKKMMFVITDGVPNHFNGGYHVPMDSYIKSCKKSMINASRVTSNIMCIVVEKKEFYKYNPVRKLFKPSKIMNVATMNNASERIIKEFKRMVVKSLV